MEDKVVEKNVYPQPYLICSVCGFMNPLDFEPKTDWGRLTDVVCGQCGNYAYWSNQWSISQMIARVLNSLELKPWKLK